MEAVQEARGLCRRESSRTTPQLCIALIDDAVARGIPGDFTFDSSFTSAKVLNHIQSQQRAYVGDLKLNRHVVYDGREQNLQGGGPADPVGRKETRAHGAEAVLVL